MGYLANIKCTTKMAGQQVTGTGQRGRLEALLGLTAVDGDVGFLEAMYWEREEDAVELVDEVGLWYA